MSSLKIFRGSGVSFISVFYFTVLKAGSKAVKLNKHCALGTPSTSLFPQRLPSLSWIEASQPEFMTNRKGTRNYCLSCL